MIQVVRVNENTVVITDSGEMDPSVFLHTAMEEVVERQIFSVFGPLAKEYLNAFANPIDIRA